MRFKKKYRNLGWFSKTRHKFNLGRYRYGRRSRSRRVRKKIYRRWLS